MNTTNSQFAAAPSSPAFRPVPADADEPSPVSSSAPEFPSAPESSEDRETKLTGFLRALLEQDPDTGTPQAMAALKASGLAITGSDCGRRLAAMRREMTSAAK